jgi:hypothetical protein
MTTTLPPSQFFSGIFYNSNFWTSASSALTQDIANTLYLEKTTPDTATALQTFSAGLSTQSMTAPSLTADVTLFPNQTAGTLKLATTARSVHCSNIDCQGNAINNASNPATGALTIGSSQTSGTISIGAGASRTSAGTITIGTADNTINFGGYLTPAYTISSVPTTAIGGRTTINAVASSGAFIGTLFLSSASVSNNAGTYLVTLNATLTCGTAGTIVSSYIGVRSGSSVDYLLAPGPTNITAVATQVYYYATSGVIFINPATTFRPFITSTGTAVCTATTLLLTITRIA